MACLDNLNPFLSIPRIDRKHLNALLPFSACLSIRMHGGVSWNPMITHRNAQFSVSRHHTTDGCRQRCAQQQKRDQRRAKTTNRAGMTNKSDNSALNKATARRMPK